MTRPLLSAAVLLFAATAAPAGDWPQFRGPDANGVVGTPVPLTWNGATGENVAWRVDVPGEGWSQPIVVGDRLFLTAAVPVDAASAPEAPRLGGRRGGGSQGEGTEYRYEVRCLDAATGETRWAKTVRTGPAPLPRHRTNTYATETPVSDGERVYALFGMTGLYALTVDGDLVWEKDLPTRSTRAGWGTAASPALHEGRLFLQEDSEEQSVLRALDAATGEELWSVDRDEPTSYGSPIVWTAGGTSQLVAGGEVARGYDPATGEELWRLDMELGRSSSTPAPAGDVLLIGTEYRDRGGRDDGGGYLAAIEPDARGDLGSVSSPGPGVRWAADRSGVQMASPAVTGDRVFLLERRGGVLHSLDLTTGEKLGRQRLPASAPFWASPLVVGDRVIALDESGTAHILTPTEDGAAVERRNELDGLFGPPQPPPTAGSTSEPQRNSSASATPARHRPLNQ